MDAHSLSAGASRWPAPVWAVAPLGLALGQLRGAGAQPVSDAAQACVRAHVIDDRPCVRQPVHNRSKKARPSADRAKRVGLPGVSDRVVGVVEEILRSGRTMFVNAIASASELSVTPVGLALRVLQAEGRATYTHAPGSKVRQWSLREVA